MISVNEEGQNGDIHYFFLIRGLIRSRFHWHHFPQVFERQLKLRNINHRVVLLDIAGNGSRFSEQAPFSIQGMADDISAQIRQYLKVELMDSTSIRLHLIGISMGGMIAAQACHILKHDQIEVSSLHVINSSFSNVARFWQRMKIPAALSLLKSLRSIQQREVCILQWTSNKLDRQKYAEAWIDEAGKNPLSIRNAIAQLIAAMRFPIPIKPLKHGYIYTSEKDRLVSSVCSKKIARAWQYPIDLEEAAGHDLSLDAPRWLAERISRNCLITKG